MLLFNVILCTIIVCNSATIRNDNPNGVCALNGGKDQSESRSFNAYIITPCDNNLTLKLKGGNISKWSEIECQDRNDSFIYSVYTVQCIHIIHVNIGDQILFYIHSHVVPTSLLSIN